MGTTKDTTVHVKTTARIIPGGPLAQGVAKGDGFDVTLQPFEVLNLETGEFNADFTGSLVDSTAPVTVFVGSEAERRPVLLDAREPLVLRRPPRATSDPDPRGGQAVRARSSPQPHEGPRGGGGHHLAVRRAGVLSRRRGGRWAHELTTSLPPPYDVVELDGEGSNVTIVAHQDFTMSASQPVHVADVQASQEAAGVVRGLPGGDPSLSYAPPVEQWRSDYVLLTPDKYAFDFLVVTAQTGSQVFLDGELVDGTV